MIFCNLINVDHLINLQFLYFDRFSSTYEMSKNEANLEIGKRNEHDLIYETEQSSRTRFIKFHFPVTFDILRNNDKNTLEFVISLLQT